MLASFPEVNLMTKIAKVAIVGGTHGNEFSGIYAIRQYEANPAVIQRPSFETSTYLLILKRIKRISGIYTVT